LQGALGTALLAMVTGLTLKKNDDADLKGFHGSLKMAVSDFHRLIEKDKKSFDEVMRSYRLPKDTQEEKERRRGAIQENLKGAARVPFEVCNRVVAMYPHAKVLMSKGLPSALSDIGVAASVLHSGFQGARLNVLINCASITDEAFNKTMKQDLQDLTAQETGQYCEIEAIINQKFQ
ncbi:MAG TPA: cyclodeaminase/cyclohydrolase family protein, partial [bacterium]